MNTQLLDCFSHHNKRRLLNLLRYYPLTLMDAVKVLGLKKNHVAKFLKEFTQTGLVQKYKVSHRVVIYYCFSVPDIPNTFRELYLSREKSIKGYNEEQFINDLFNTDIDKFIITMYQNRKINSVEYFPKDFISEVFRMFQIDDLQFVKDKERYSLLLPQMKAITYMRESAREFKERVKLLSNRYDINLKIRRGKIRMHKRLIEQGWQSIKNVQPGASKWP